MHRLVPCLATLAILSLTACKRDRNSNEPDEGSEGSQASSPTPTPEQVCTRLSEMIAIELGGVDPEVQRATIVDCTAEMVGEQQLRGPEGWDNIARCVMAAQNEADIDRCDQLYPPVAAGGTSTTPHEATKEDQVCVIMVSNFAIEIMAEAEARGEPPPELVDQDIRNAHAECLRSLEQARQVRSGADYDQLLNCLGAATSGAAMDQCLD
jgi:hypothetical protein